MSETAPCCTLHTVWSLYKLHCTITSRLH